MAQGRLRTSRAACVPYLLRWSTTPPRRRRRRRRWPPPQAGLQTTASVHWVREGRQSQRRGRRWCHCCLLWQPGRARRGRPPSTRGCRAWSAAPRCARRSLRGWAAHARRSRLPAALASRRQPRPARALRPLGPPPAARSVPMLASGARRRLASRPLRRKPRWRWRRQRRHAACGSPRRPRAGHG
eukprot:365717-Chlamydomonas_euryale.AAC.17